MIIYEIVCNITGERYIGSTKNTLKKRLQEHKCSARTQSQRPCSSKQIIVRGDYKANILEEGDFDRHEREQHHMDALPHINSQRAIQSMEYKREYNLKWRQQPHIKERKRLRVREKRSQNIDFLNKERKYARERAQWRASMGGDERRHNNLLNISMDLFQ